MLKLAARLQKLALRKGNVLIQGDSGTGKEVVARKLHLLSTRAQEPFVAVNCGSLPGQLLTSELFGYRKGAFTGAVREHPGKIGLARGGTLFLDEIGELPLEAQAMLLRALQEKKICPLGGELEEEVDFRLVCATNRDLEEEICKGSFRADLFYRVAVFRLQLPTLQERFMDIPMLAHRIWKRLQQVEECQESDLNLRELTILQRCSWPGNVRQLANILEQYLAFRCEGAKLEEFLPEEGFRQSKADGGPGQLEEALELSGYNKSRAARHMGISRGALIHRMQKWGVSGQRKDQKSRSIPVV